jgi:hypothetical protein
MFVGRAVLAKPRERLWGSEEQSDERGAKARRTNLEPPRRSRPRSGGGRLAGLPPGGTSGLADTVGAQ